MKSIFLLFMLFITSQSFAAVPPDEAVASMLNALNSRTNGEVDRGLAGSDYNDCIRISDTQYAQRCEICKKWYSKTLSMFHQCEGQARRDALQREDTCRELELVHEANNKDIKVQLGLDFFKQKQKENAPTFDQMVKGRFKR
jgi:hypothetical protein